MRGHTTIPLLTVMLFGFCTFEGEAQVLCHSERCYTSAPIGHFSTPQDCCLVDNAVSWEGFGCGECLIYGWKDTFPIEAKIGDTVILTVGYLKGYPPGRILFEVEYDTNEVSIDRTSVLLGSEDERVQVTVLDDGQSVLEAKNITITLVRRAGGSATDVVFSEAILTISANTTAFQNGFRVRETTISEGEFQQICLVIVGAALDTALNVTVIYNGSAGPEDFNLITTQVTITATNTQPCVRFEAVADSLGLEGVENLTLTLTGPPNIQLTTAILTVHILDTTVLCPNLTDPVDGRVHLSGVAVGDTASFICASGYELIGHPLLTCFSDGHWDNSPPTCLRPNVYGWKDTFPIEVKKGDTVILTVGYLRGTPVSRVLVTVEYDSNEVSVDRTSVILRREDERVQVTVLDDGQSVLEDKNITITLVRGYGGSAHDILISEAILTVAANTTAFQNGFRVRETTISEGEFQQICLVFVGATLDTVLNVNVIYNGSAGPEDFNLITTQVTITATNTQPCVRFEAVTDSLGLEGVENLTLALTGPPNTQLTAAILTVYILDTTVLCPNLTDPVDGRVHLSGVAVGDTASFICASGYELVGHPLLTCLSDGYWDSSPPICQSAIPIVKVIESGIEVTVNFEGAQNIKVIVRDSNENRYQQQEKGGAVVMTFSNLPSGRTRVRANVKTKDKWKISSPWVVVFLMTGAS